jgi:hypothetical protein
LARSNIINVKPVSSLSKYSDGEIINPAEKPADFYSLYDSYDFLKIYLYL